VKGAVGSVRNKNFEISFSYRIFADIIRRLDICKVAQRDNNGKLQLFVCILGCLKQHVSAQPEETNRQIRCKRIYYVSFITIFHIIGPGVT
jgi:hypothetical protein